MKPSHIAKSATNHSIYVNGNGKFSLSALFIHLNQSLKANLISFLKTIVYWIKLTLGGWLVILMGLTNKASGQCMSIPVKLEQRVEKSTTIVKAVVKDKESYKDKKGNIYTFNLLEVHTILKGDSSLSTIGAITIGGEIGNEMQISYPAVQLDIDNQYVLFLEENNETIANPDVKAKYPELQQCLIYADAQGALQFQHNQYIDALYHKYYSEEELFSLILKMTGGNLYNKIPSTAQRLVNNQDNAATAAILSIIPDNTLAGTINLLDFITITGTGFGLTRGTNNVSFRNVNDGGASWVIPIATDYVLWTDVSIIVKVPENAGTGTIDVAGTLSSTPITVRYSHTAVNSSFSGFGSNMRQRFHLRNKNSNGGYTLSPNSTSGFSGNSQAVTTLLDAMDTWTCNTGMNWQLGSNTLSEFALDGENVVMFDASLPVGVLGRLTNRLSAGSSGGCSGTNTVWWVNEFDLQMRPDPPVTGTSWEYGPSLPSSSEYDFESVILHELGHAHGLGHRMANGQTMHYAVSNGVASRSLDSNEIRAGLEKLAYSTTTTCFNPGGSGTPMTLQSCSSVLPVELISFNAIKEEEHVVVSWKTASEFNNDYFTIERSKDALNFTPIGVKYSIGNSNRLNEYSFIDYEPLDGVSYYRLKQTDYDGTFSYSRTVMVIFDKNNTQQFSIYPNPANEIVTISMTGKPVSGNITITDVSGKNIIQQVINKSDGIQTIELDVSNLAKGIYLVEFNTEGKSTRSKLVKN